MNRKQFFVLLAVVALLGAAGLAIVWRDLADYAASEARIGAKLLPKLKIADVSEIRLRDGKSSTTLQRKEKNWVVAERAGYPASFQEISDFMIKLVELKVTQSEQVGAPLWPRLDLAEPAQGGDGTGTLIEFRGDQDKPLAALVLGKKVLKRDPLNPLPTARDGVPAGRYVRVEGTKDTVVVVSDPLNAAEASPGRWLDKDFLKVDRVRTLAVGPQNGAPSWKITREEEWGQWKFAGGGGDLDPSAAVTAVNRLGSLSFRDVATGARPDTDGRPIAVVAETFDGLVYTITLAKLSGSKDHLLNFTLKGEPPVRRVREKGEKDEEAARRDKEFSESRRQLEQRLAAERALSKWTYVVSGEDIEPILVERKELLARRRDRR